MDIEEYKQTIKKLERLNKVVKSRLSGMLYVQNQRSLKMNSGLRFDDFLPRYLCNLWGNVDFNYLEDGKVWITYCGHCRGEGFTEDIKLPLECFTAETDEQAFDAYVNSFQKKYAEEDEREARRMKAIEEMNEMHDRAEYERLKKKYEQEDA